MLCITIRYHVEYFRANHVETGHEVAQMHGGKYERPIHDGLIDALHVQTPSTVDVLIAQCALPRWRAWNV